MMLSDPSDRDGRAGGAGRCEHDDRVPLDLPAKAPAEGRAIEHLLVPAEPGSEAPHEEAS